MRHFLLLAVFLAQAGMAQTTLVFDGQPRAFIVLAADAGDADRRAAGELQTYIQRMSNALIPILPEADASNASGTRIIIGPAATLDVSVAAGTVQLLGTYAVNELLEQLGVRWFMPGDLGTVVPSMATITVEDQDTVQHPGFTTRLLQAIGDRDWARHLRLDGPNYGRHGFPCKVKRGERPELFLKDEDGRPTDHLDVSVPAVLDCVVTGALAELKKAPGLKYLSMGPEDGVPAIPVPNPAWDGTDHDPAASVLSSTDRYVRFFNLVLEQVSAAGYPDVGIAFYAYSSYMRPPVRWRPNPKIMPLFAPIMLDRLHAIDNPLSWERAYLENLILGWQANGVQTGYRGYLFNLADPGLPFSMLRQVASEFRIFKDRGMHFMRVETMPAWAYHGPSLYLAAKMMWNPQLDVEATLTDYFAKFYGPAADPMRRHFDLLESAFANADYFTGSAFDFPRILTASVMSELQASLSEAEQRVPEGSDYAARLAMVRIAFDFGAHFLTMMADIQRSDFVAAKAQLDEVNRLSAIAVSHQPPVLYERAQSYIDRFWGAMVNDGYAKATAGNRVLVRFPDEWYVMLFPNGSGDQMGLWKPGLGMQSWMRLKTLSSTWSNQGLRYYKGDAWYRTTFDLPEGDVQEGAVHLWFGGLDETARVWINGLELPLLRVGTVLGRPWEFDATTAVRFDGPNEIAVDVANNYLNEIGTGGITGPVMLYQVRP